MRLRHPTGTDGGGCVPYREAFGSPTNRSNYADVWFSNRGEPNHIYALGAAYHDHLGDHHAGVSLAAENWSYVFVGELEDWWGADAWLANADAAVHEFGHQFELTPTDDEHPDVWCHDGTDKCVMTYTAGWTDGIAEFCYEGQGPPVHPNCIHQVRCKADGL